jgi:hypothetical protein
MTAEPRQARAQRGDAVGATTGEGAVAREDRLRAVEGDFIG